MPIVSSVIVEDRTQVDGRRSVRERHIDQVDAVQFVAYLALAGVDVAAIMAARVALLDAALIANEIDRNMADVSANGSLAVIRIVHSTVAQNAAALRAFYATATQEQAVMIGDFLSTLTNGQLQTAFSLTAGQVTALRTNKLSPAASLAASLRAAVGQ